MHNAHLKQKKTHRQRRRRCTRRRAGVDEKGKREPTFIHQHHHRACAQALKTAEKSASSWTNFCRSGTASSPDQWMLAQRLLAKAKRAESMPRMWVHDHRIFFLLSKVQDGGMQSLSHSSSAAEGYLINLWPPYLGSDGCHMQ